MNISNSRLEFIEPEGSPEMPNQDNTLRVVWRLLNTCGRHSPGKIDDNCVMMPSRLADMAWKILATPRKYYDITLCGGEPMLHPGLLELSRRLLSTRRKVALTVETYGVADLDSYVSLLGRIPPGSMRLLIKFDPRHSNIPHLLKLIALVAERGQLADVSFCFNNVDSKELINILFKLRLLRRVVPYNISTINTNLPLLTKITANFQKAFEIDIQSGPKHVQSWQNNYWKNQNFEDLPTFDLANAPEVYCVAGANALYIDPDGYFHGSTCGKLPGNQRLFNVSPDALNNYMHVIRCRDKTCNEDPVCRLPKFRSLQHAEKYIDQFKRLINYGPEAIQQIPQPGGQAPTIAQRAIGQLENLGVRFQPDEARDQLSLENSPQPDIAARRFEDIGKIYEALEDEASRIAWLCMLKAIETGDARWLQISGGKALEPESRDDIVWNDLPSEDELNEAIGCIRQNKPSINLILQPTIGHALDLPLFLLKSAPGYSFAIYQQDGVIVLHARHADDRLKKLVYKKDHEYGIDASVLVVPGSDYKELRATLDSILAQRGCNVEAIVVKKEGDEEKILRQYAECFPDKVKLAPSDKKFGNRLNGALAMSNGEFVAILMAGQRLDPDFLEKGISALRETGADAAAFSALLGSASSGFTIVNAPNAVYNRDDALTAFFNDKLGLPFTQLFRHSMLRKNEIIFKNLAEMAPLAFAMEAVYNSTKVISINDPGGFSQHAGHGTSLVAYADFVEFVVHFFHDNLVGNEQNCSRFIKKIYGIYRSNIFKEILDKSSNLEKTLERGKLLKIAQCKPALFALMEDYASIQASFTSTRFDVNNLEDIPAVVCEPQCECRPYKNSDNPTGSIPRLSIIVTSYNKQKFLPDCLDSILTQKMWDLEVIVVDDCSTDESAEIIMDYADDDARVRFYRMAANRGQSVCQNFALEKIRAPYFMIVDADDMLAPGFLPKGLDEAIAHNADLAAFSCRCVAENGADNIDTHTIPAGIYRNEQAARLATRPMFIPSTWAKIYRTEFALATCAKFPPRIFHQDQHFMASLLTRARTVIMSPVHAYKMRFSANSSVRPKNVTPLHIHSACRLYALFDELAGKDFHACLVLIETHVKGNFENIHGLLWEAYIRRFGEMRLQEDDYALLGHNFLFTAALLLLLSRKDADNPGRSVFSKHQHWHPWSFDGLAKPLVTVIVPIFNQEDALNRCIRSILDQSLNSLELILVDDASTDNTASICSFWAAKDKRVKIITNDVNCGQGYCRNVGMDAANGDFIAFVDSDDYILPDFLLHGVALLNNIPDADFVHFPRILEKEGCAAQQPAKEDIKLLSGEYALEDYCKGESDCFEIWGKIYRREFILTNNLCFPEHMFEDSLFLLNVLARARNMLRTSLGGYVYAPAVHPASTMNPVRYTPRHVRGNFALCAGISRFFRENDFNGEKLAMRRIAARYKTFAKEALLDYFASFADIPASPLTAEDLDNLAESPEFFSIILQDYASLKGKRELKRLAKINCQHAEPKWIGVKPQKQPQLTIVYHLRTQDDAKELLKSLRPHITPDVELIVCAGLDDDYRWAELVENAGMNARLCRLPVDSSQSEAWNAGLRHATGNNIAFIESGSRLQHGFIPRFLALDNMADVAFCSNDSEVAEDLSPLDVCVAFLEGRALMNCGWIFKRDFLDRSGLSFDATPIALANFIIRSTYLADSFASLNIPAWSGGKSGQACSRFNFKDTLGALLEILELSRDLPSKDKETLQKKYAQYILSSPFWTDFLSHIAAERKEGESFPIPQEGLSAIARAYDFTRTMIMDYALAWQKIKKVNSSSNSE